jgi:hypothetical protein
MSLWTEIVSTAVIGCERKPLSLNGATVELGVLLGRLDRNDREGALLSAAALASLYGRAENPPMKDAQPAPEACGPDDTPRCSAQAAAHLEKILRREHHANLTEWVVRVTVGNHHAPEELLPILLELGRTLKWSREKIAPALGARGLWLAAQNPDWAYAVGGFDECL